MDENTIKGEERKVTINECMRKYVNYDNEVEEKGKEEITETC